MTDLFTREAGPPDGLPVVFLHAFPMDHRMWSRQVAAVASFARALSYNLRGHGQSPLGDGQYTLEGHVDDLIALLDEKGISRAVLVGLSLGGYVVLRALERHPERIRGAVLCDTRSEADGNEAKLRRFAQIRGIRSEGLSFFVDGFLKAVLRDQTLRSRPEIVKACRDMIEANPPRAVIGTLLALASRTDTTGSLASIRCPVLILVGEDDRTTPPAASEAMRSRIPDSELRILPGAAHLSNLENPAEFNHFLLDFLKRIGRTGSPS